MQKHHHIEVFEHERLTLGEKDFRQTHLDALLQLNDRNDGRYFEPVFQGVKFNQFVGIIQVDGLVIDIHPKADRNDPDSKWRGVLLHMLTTCGKIRPATTGAAHVQRQHLNLLEIYFSIYLEELEKLLHLGLVKNYRRKTSNLHSLKGKLEFAGHIQKNLVHRERFYTTHQIYDHDHVLHRALLTALDIVERCTRATWLHDQVRRIQFAFPEMETGNINESQLDRIQLNRKTQHYEYALEIARLIILHYSPDIHSGQERMLAILFDMNELWEEYIYAVLRHQGQREGFEVKAQESKPFWGSTTLRPDIVVEKDGKTTVLDTKWKLPKNGQPGTADLRQIYAYCRFWGAEKGVLIYPGIAGITQSKIYEIVDLLEDGFNELGTVKHKAEVWKVPADPDGSELEMRNRIINYV